MQYIVDNRGVKTSVIVPFEKWEKLNSDYLKLQKKIEVFQTIKESIEEIRLSKKNGKKLPTLSEFLNENIG